MLNEVTLIGRITADPELRYTAGEGIPVANFTMAVDRPFTPKNGEKETDFVRIVAWRKQAENSAAYLSKGRAIAVNGRLQVRSYDDKEGIRRTIAEVVANRVVFLPDGKNGGVKNENNASDEQASEVSDEDVPF